MGRRLFGLLPMLLCACATPGAPQRDGPPADMETIEAGLFLRGSTDTEARQLSIECGAPESPCPVHWFTSETPQRQITLSTFAIDRTEVTVEAYHQCVAEQGCAPIDRTTCYVNRDGIWQMLEPHEVDVFLRPELPIVCARWQDAYDYCAWRGKRLPTEAEWERAAGGQTASRYPWGQSRPTCAQAVFGGCGDGPRPAHEGEAYGGLKNMAGNVSEWVEDYNHPGFYAASQAVDPLNKDWSKERVTRGGHFESSPVMLRARNRAAFGPDFRSVYTGFRCAWAADSE